MLQQIQDMEHPS